MTTIKINNDMKTALEILRETYEELSKPDPTEWKSFEDVMTDGTGEAVLKAMEQYADQFRLQQVDYSSSAPH